MRLEASSITERTPAATRNLDQDLLASRLLGPIAMVLYPPPSTIWQYCFHCGIRLTREEIDTPTPDHERWCTPRSRLVKRLVKRVILQRWRDFTERLLASDLIERQRKWEVDHRPTRT